MRCCIHVIRFPDCNLSSSSPRVDKNGWGKIACFTYRLGVSELSANDERAASVGRHETFGARTRPYPKMTSKRAGVPVVVCFPSVACSPPRHSRPTVPEASNVQGESASHRDVVSMLLWESLRGASNLLSSCSVLSMPNDGAWPPSPRRCPWSVDRTLTLPRALP